MYVSQLDEKKRESIKKGLESALRKEGIYTEEEIQESVRLGMDSRLEDLSDIIDISKYK